MVFGLLFFFRFHLNNLHRCVINAICEYSTKLTKGFELMRKVNTIAVQSLLPDKVRSVPRVCWDLSNFTVKHGQNQTKANNSSLTNVTYGAGLRLRINSRSKRLLDIKWRFDDIIRKSALETFQNNKTTFRHSFISSISSSLRLFCNFPTKKAAFRKGSSFGSLFSKCL